MTKYWFKPKKYGYGASPKSWEGWLVTISFIFYIFALIKFLNPKTISFFVYFFIGIIALSIIAKVKTKEQWKWRWGND